MDKRTAWGLIATLVIGMAASDAAAVCGAGVVDADTFENCDHGAANGQDGGCSATCQIVDADGDGLCDARDACNNGLGIRIKEATLKVGRLVSSPGDNTLRFAGTLTIPNVPTIDPASSGIRLTMYDPFGDPRGATVADVTIPEGPGWRVSQNGTSWRYRDPAGQAGGITRIAMRIVPQLVPYPRLTKVAFSLAGRGGSFPVTPAMVTVDLNDFTGSTLQVTLTFGPGSVSTFQCGSVYYSTIQPYQCEFSASGDRATCKGPRPGGPCHIGDPDDLIVCDARNAAEAEGVYFAQTGSYRAGSCDDLPGFKPSPDVTCTVIVFDGGFAVATSHPAASRSCSSYSTEVTCADGTVANLCCS
jgi:hypothetical protein